MKPLTKDDFQKVPHRDLYLLRSITVYEREQILKWQETVVRLKKRIEEYKEQLPLMQPNSKTENWCINQIEELQKILGEK